MVSGGEPCHEETDGRWQMEYRNIGMLECRRQRADPARVTRPWSNDLFRNPNRDDRTRTEAHDFNRGCVGGRMQMADGR